MLSLATIMTMVFGGIVLGLIFEYYGGHDE